jgi:hypothetical protein
MLVQTKNPRTPQMGYAVQIFRLPLANAAILGLTRPLNQINIRTEGDHLVDLSKRSNVVAELKTYKAFRIYHADHDEEAKRKITEIMDTGISKWPA